MSDTAYAPDLMARTISLPSGLEIEPPERKESWITAIAVVDIVSRFCLVAAFVLLIPIASLTIAQAAFGYHSYALQTNDMAPDMGAGSLIISHPTGGDQLRVGDVIAFHPPGNATQLTTRRIVAIRKGPQQRGAPPYLLVTKADGSTTLDPWLIPSTATVDREVMHVPFVGYPAAALQTRIGRFLFLVLPAALLTLIFFSERVRVSKARRRREARERRLAERAA